MTGGKGSDQSAARSVLSDTTLGGAAADAGRVLRRVQVTRNAWVAVGLAVLATAVYLFTSSRDRENLDYFIRLADAMMHGRIYLTEAPSWLTELIPHGGVWYVAYPPMPAVLLIPFVAVLGTEMHQQVVSSLFAGISVGLTYLVLCRFSLSERVRVGLTLVFAFGTCLFYVAEVGNTWYFAQVCAVMFSTAAVLLTLHRRWPLLVGLLLGFAVLSRLPVVLSAPFFAAMLAGLGWPLRIPEDRARAIRSVLLFGAGLAIPLAAFALYNVGRFGSPFEFGYALIPGVLEERYYTEGIFSIAYIPRHIYAIFFRSWIWNDDFPYLWASWWGLAITFTTPLFFWVLKARLQDPRVLWAAVGIALTLIPVVTHGNVGFTQFGYRFSLDVQPLLFVVLATVYERGMSRLAWVAAVLSVAFCTYGVWAIGAGFVDW